MGSDLDTRNGQSAGRYVWRILPLTGSSIIHKGNQRYAAYTYQVGTSEVRVLVLLTEDGEKVFAPFVEIRDLSEGEHELLEGTIAP